MKQFSAFRLASTLVSAAVLAVVTAVAPSQAQENYSQWSNHKFLILRTTAQGANVPGPVYRVPVLVRLDSVNFGAGFAQAASGGRDIRFTKPGDAVRLPHQIEQWDSAGKKAAIWVLVDSIRGLNITNIRMHWGRPAAADSSKGSAVFETANGFGAVYHMSEASGDVSDATANNNTGTNTGTTTTAGMIGAARNFAGGNLANNTATNVQYISVGSPASLDLGTSGSRLTFEAWVRWTRIRPTAGSSYWRTAIFRAGGATSDDEVHLRVENPSPRAYRAGAYVSTVDYGPVSPLGAAEYGDSLQWVHLVGVYDSADANFNIWRLYRNGVQLSEGFAGDQAPTGTGTWYVGGYYANGNTQRRFWAGDLDEVRISKVHRSAFWVKLSYENQKPAQSLVAFSDTLVPPLSVRSVRSVRGAAPARGPEGPLSAKVSGSGVLFRLEGLDGIGAGTLHLSVLDVRGRELWSRSETEGSARREIFWDGLSGSGRVAPGIYAVRAVIFDASGVPVQALERRIPLLR